MSIYVQDQKAWLPCDREGWKKCTIVQVNDTTLIVRTLDGEVCMLERLSVLRSENKRVFACLTCYSGWR